ncbi:helix-hairpin-helix domain-containing protein [Anaerolineales bacterium HSG6]|nr:helix-hairpin-helix domain-containing protein [Anaerolineales bacterium HSG6]
MLLAGIHILHTNGCPITTFGHDIWEVYFLGVTLIVGWVARGFGEQTARKKLSVAETVILQLKTNADEAKQVAQDLKTTKHELEQLKQKLADQNQAQRSDATAEQLKQDLMAARSELEELKQQLKQKQTKKKDDLTKVNGIGPVFARRLNEAGIFTFVDLVALSADDVRKIVVAKDWQKIEPEKWLIQAQSLTD